MARHVNWLPPVEQRPDRYAGQSRRLIVEQLESRNLLASASDPAQDAEEDPEFGDAFIVSHYIDIHGPGRVPVNPASNEANFDVDGDGWITAQDVLFLINLVNERRETESDEDGGDRAQPSIEAAHAGTDDPA